MKRSIAITSRTGAGAVVIALRWRRLRLGREVAAPAVAAARAATRRRPSPSQVSPSRPDRARKSRRGAAPHAAALGLGRHARRAPRGRPDRQPAVRRHRAAGLGMVGRRYRPPRDRADRRPDLLRDFLDAPTAGGGSGGTPAYAGGYGWVSRAVGSRSGGSAYSGGGSSAPPVAVLEAPAELSDLDRGLGHIRQMDAQFDPGRLRRDRDGHVLQDPGGVDQPRHGPGGRSPDARDARCAAERNATSSGPSGGSIASKTSRCARPTVTEAWQEKGQDFVTVYFLASLVDYTTDESGRRRCWTAAATEPVKFEEYWTFVRPVGPNPWKLSAIQQAA